MTAHSRNKGKAGERELAKALVEHGLCAKARRSQQYCGGAGDADVVGIPGVHIECKRVESLNIHKAVKQATDDARDGDVPAVFHRRNRGEWLVTVPLARLLEFSRIVCNDPTHTEDADGRSPSVEIEVRKVEE